MSRQLRPRKTRPSYVAMAGFDFEEDPEAAKTAAIVAEEEGDSGSDFAPEPAAQSQADAEEESDDDLSVDAENDEEKGELDDEDQDSVAFSTATASKASSRDKGKAKAKPEVTRAMIGLPSGFSRASRRQMYVLPTPSVHHRHRAVPLFSSVGQVERLVAPPALFQPPKTTLTNNFTLNSSVSNRVNKAWGYNVGPGPLWELLEDRGWYKEALDTNDTDQKEGTRRPRVYKDVSVQGGWEILNTDDAASYLPTDIVTTEEGNFKPPPPVACSFGPFGAQTRIEMKMFDSLKISKFIPESKAHIFSAGAPIWGLDWCPIHIDDRHRRGYKQYLAVAPFPSRAHSPDIGTKVLRPSHACIQIWSLASESPGLGTGSRARSSKTSSSDQSAQMKCEMVLCLEGGAAHEIKWCPLPSHDVATASSSSKSVSGSPRKLGLLAGTFEDGSVSIYVVPDPADLTPGADHDPLQPIFVRLPEPVLRIELEETACWTLDWANSEILAVGTTHGVLAVYNIGQALKDATNAKLDTPTTSAYTAILPTHYLTVHQSAIRALCWIRAPPCWPSGVPRTDEDPTVIASGGYDGVECLTDIREGHGSVMNRTRDVINTITFSPFGGGPITIDHENIVKAYSASPSMLGRGHMLVEPNGPVWSLDASDYHPQLAVGSADGACTTTNTLRSTRRGGSVPFFVHKVYQLDYSRTSGEYRMLERFLPQETQDRPTATRAAKVAKAKDDPAPKALTNGTGAWPSEIGIHRVSWNQGNGLAAAGMLASGSAAGLCRVDILDGRWLKGKIPYGSVAEIRREGSDDMDVDDEDDDDDSPAE